MRSEQYRNIKDARWGSLETGAFHQTLVLSRVHTATAETTRVRREGWQNQVPDWPRCGPKEVEAVAYCSSAEARCNTQPSSPLRSRASAGIRSQSRPLSLGFLGN